MDVEKWILNNMNDLDRLYSLYLNNIKNERFFVPDIKKRFKEFKEGKDTRLNILWGLRGTGKTTGILQAVKELEANKLFLFGDSSEFIEPLEAVKIYSKLFPKENLILIIDEIHEIKDWDKKLKNIYDSYPHIFIVCTGSSAIGIKSTKIARRAVYYNITPLDFKEYLYLKHNISISPEVSKNIKDALKSEHPYENLMPYYIEIKKLNLYQYINEFIKMGGFPLLNTPKDLYYKKVYDILQRVIDQDIPQFSKFTTNTLSKTSKILNSISTANDSKVSITSLSQKFDISRPMINEILEILNSANLIIKIPAKGMKKNEKIYFSTPSLRYAINSRLNLPVDIGIIREETIVSHLINSEIIIYYIKTKGKEYDFVFNIDGKKIRIEIGGKSKSSSQINNEGIIIADTDVISFNKVPVIPLYLFLLI